MTSVELMKQARNDSLHVSSYTFIHGYIDKCDGVIFSPLSLWEKRGNKYICTAVSGHFLCMAGFELG
jgi:hypothetical protein